MQKYTDSNTYITLLSKLYHPRLFIFDNSPVAQHKQCDFDDLSEKYISDTSNHGLSYAYNRAAEYAKNNGIEWMMVLDQDTFVDSNIITKFQEVRQKNPEIKLFVPKIKVDTQLYMSPVKMSGFRTRLAVNVPNGVVSTLEYVPINSGMIINVEALLSVGGYNEKVWLDHSDYQFMKRFNTVYNEMYILDSECLQEFSNIVQPKSQKLKRFEIFCECVKNCERDNIKDNLNYLYLVAKRAVSLIFATRSFTPINIFLKKYL